MSQDTGFQQQAETPSAEAPRQHNPTYVRILLITVIGLGVLMVVGAAVVIGTVIKRINNPESIPQKPGFGETEISIPADARLLRVENGDARIVLRLEDKNGAFLILLDPRKGTEKGRIRLTKQ
jgi:hypothetical protein